MDGPTGINTGTAELRVLATAGGSPQATSSEFSIIQPGVITTVVGNGTLGSSGDNGPAGSAELNEPDGVALDSQGDIFIADCNNSEIREVNAKTGVITTVAGTGTAGYSGDGSQATRAELNDPRSVVIDSQGDILIPDSGNNRVREVNATTHVITTIAGDGFAGYSGDNDPATDASLSFPHYIALDSLGYLYIIDEDNNVIREVNATTHIITTVAGMYDRRGGGYSGDDGPATSARLNDPLRATVDSQGDVFFSDGANNVIRVIAGLETILPTVQFSAASETVNQSTGAFSITVDLSAASDQAVSVPFMPGGTAVSGTDYSGLTASPLNIAAGSTSATINGKLPADYGQNQTLSFTLGTPTYATLGSMTVNTLTITEPQPTVQFSASSETVNQSAGSFSVSVTLSHTSNQTVSVPFTPGGTAANGTDYSSLTASPLNIAAGSTSATINGKLPADYGRNQTLSFTLGTPTYATLGSTTVNTLTITEPQPTVQFSASSETVNQSAGSFSVSVTLSHTSNQAVSVPFTPGGTAVSGTDYSGLTASPLSIAAGMPRARSAARCRPTPASTRRSRSRWERRATPRWGPSQSTP